MHNYILKFYDRMTVHLNRSLWIKRTDALNSNFISVTTLHVSGSLSVHYQEFLAVRRICVIEDMRIIFWIEFISILRAASLGSTQEIQTLNVDMTNASHVLLTSIVWCAYLN